MLKSKLQIVAARTLERRIEAGREGKGREEHKGDA